MSIFFGSLSDFSTKPFGYLPASTSFQSIVYRASFYNDFTSTPRSDSSHHYDDTRAYRSCGGTSIAPLAVTSSAFFNSTFAVNVVEKIGLVPKTLSLFQLFLALALSFSKATTTTTTTTTTKTERTPTIQFVRTLDIFVTNVFSNYEDFVAPATQILNY